MASDKVRREKWEKEKIHEIRAQTVKGLEPEIQRIVERNKEELRKAHELHQSDSRSKKEKLSEEYEKKISDLRDKLSNERE
jgi:5-azacytidine-induced protein 1